VQQGEKNHLTIVQLFYFILDANGVISIRHLVMTEKKNGCYVWVTWLAKLMAGDVHVSGHYVQVSLFVNPKAP